MGYVFAAGIGRPLCGTPSGECLVEAAVEHVGVSAEVGGHLEGAGVHSGLAFVGEAPVVVVGAFGSSPSAVVAHHVGVVGDYGPFPGEGCFQMAGAAGHSVTVTLDSNNNEVTFTIND